MGAVKLLLSLGADPLRHSELDVTALHIAASYGHSECAKIILQHDPRTLSESDGFVLVFFFYFFYSCCGDCLASGILFFPAISFMIEKDDNLSVSVRNGHQ